MVIFEPVKGHEETRVTLVMWKPFDTIRTSHEPVTASVKNLCRLHTSQRLRPQFLPFSSTTLEPRSTITAGGNVCATEQPPINIRPCRVYTDDEPDPSKDSVFVESFVQHNVLRGALLTSGYFSRSFEFPQAASQL